MSYTLKQTRRFARTYQKLHDNVAADVDAAALTVAADPTVGERKKGIWPSCMSTNSAARTSYTSSATPLMTVFAWSIWKRWGRMRTFTGTSNGLRSSQFRHLAPWQRPGFRSG
jgi:hypothetical protein